MQVFKFYLKNGNTFVGTHPELYKAGHSQEDIEREDFEYDEDWGDPEINHAMFFRF